MAPLGSREVVVVERVIREIVCDWCDAPMPSERRATNCGAVVIELGYSDGAFGGRQDYNKTGSFSDLCPGCYSAFHQWAMTYHNLRENRRLSR